MQVKIKNMCGNNRETEMALRNWIFISDWSGSPYLCLPKGDPEGMRRTGLAMPHAKSAVINWDYTGLPAHSRSFRGGSHMRRDISWRKNRAATRMEFLGIWVGLLRSLDS